MRVLALILALVLISVMFGAAFWYTIKEFGLKEAIKGWAIILSATVMVVATGFLLSYGLTGSIE